MRINRIVLKNFKAIRDYDTGELPDGIIGITGGNGQGKSTLLTAISYALYGPESLATGRADAVTWGTKKAQVDLHFSVDTDEYALTRTQDTKGNSKAELWHTTSGNQIASGATTVNNAIEQMIGIDLIGFQSSVFSRQDDLLGLGSLQPARRVSTILRLLGIDQIDKAIKYVNERNKEFKSELEMQRRSLEQMPDLDVESTQRALLSAKDSLAEAKHRVSEHSEITKSAASYLAGMEKQYLTYIDLSAKYSRLQGQLQSASETVERLERELESEPTPPVMPDPFVDPVAYAKRTTVYAEQSRRLREAWNKSECPTCGRPWDNVDQNHLFQEQERLADELKSIEADARIATESEAYLNSLSQYETVLLPRYQQAGQRITQAQSAKDKILEDIVNLNVKAVSDPTDEYHKARAEYDAALDALRVGEKRVDILTSEVSMLTDQLQRYEKFVTAQREIADNVKALEKTVVDYATCSSELASFKTKMVSGVIPALSDKASSLIAQITEGKYSEVALSPQYDIQYRNELGELKAFPNLSGGEKDAFALAMRLAIADLRASKIGILVLDEIFESLDSDRQEATWQALEQMSGRFNQVFLVTHVETYKDRAPYTISM